MRRNKFLLANLCVAAGMAAAYFSKVYLKKKRCILQEKVNKLQDDYWLLNHWLEIKNESKSVASYFMDKGYRHIAIYGMAELGNRLMEDLEESPICVDYGIDRNICCSIARIGEIYYPEDDLPETQAIVVTPYVAFEAIRKTLETKVDCPIISLEEIVWSV